MKILLNIKIRIKDKILSSLFVLVTCQSISSFLHKYQPSVGNIFLVLLRELDEVDVALENLMKKSLKMKKRTRRAGKQANKIQDRYCFIL